MLASVLVPALLAGCGPAARPAVIAQRPASTTSSVATPAVAATILTGGETASDALSRFWSSQALSEGWFAPSFLAQVAVSEIQKVRGRLDAQLGKLSRIERDGAGYRCIFEGGIVPAQVALDADGRFMTLWFGPPQPAGTTPSAASAALFALAKNSGQASVLVVQDGKDRVALNADARLAVGSTFKLAILAALREQIDARRRSWNDIVHLDPRWKSLPAGWLQNWPNGTALTVQSLATAMISVSDNTAADALLSLVGPAAAERFAPGARPFLSTRQAFVLKYAANADLLARWRASSETERRALLPTVDDRPLPKVDDATTAGTLDVEWHLSAHEICALMGKVQDLALMSVNPGVAEPSQWDRVAYKGGSEAGVISATTWLVRGKTTFCVSATWNDGGGVEESRFLAAYDSLLRALHDGG